MAEIVAAFPDVQVAVADAGGLDLDQHLFPCRLRRRLVDFLQRRIEIGDLEALHGVSPGYSWFLGRTLPRLASRRREQTRNCIPRRGSRPRFCRNFVPPEHRGRREDRVRAAPAVSRASSRERKRTRAYRFSGEHSGLPCAMVLTAYIVLSLVNGFLATIIAADCSPTT